jgi:peptide subunit release factor 1 (eRF1)
MITQEDLQELLAFDPQSAQVVSLYLDADTSQQTSETIKLQVRTMLKDISSIETDAATIERYLDFSHDWGIPGLALFSCASRDFFRAYPTAIGFRNRLRVGRRPHLKPLTHLLDYYANYGVIVVDRVGARLFEYHLGELQKVAVTEGDDVRKLKLGGGWARGGGTTSAGGQRGGQGARHGEEVASRNMRDAATAAQKFFANRPIRRLFIGGTAENVAQFRENLSKQLQSRTAGTFAVDMNEGEREIHQRSLALLREANSEREQKVVRNLITTAAKGGNAVIGLDPTLKGIGEGRVQPLVISDGYRTPGFIDEHSKFLTVYEGDTLPFAESKLTAVEDVIEEAVSNTMELGGSVEIIRDNPDLEKAGQIGALLRY